MRGGLLQKLEKSAAPKPRHMPSFESFLLATVSPADADDALSMISHAPIADFLPAEREDRHGRKDAAALR